MSGDLPDSGIGNPLTLLPFDIGTNTVSGSSGDADSGADQDSFAFTVPAGAQLISGQVSATEVIGIIFALGWNLSSGSANSGSGTFLENLFVNPPGADALAGVPLGPGVYNLTTSGLGTEGQPSFADYTFTFELQAVPEPGSLALLATGLFGTLALRCRRRRAE